MANVVDTKLYDILGVSPSASENELKKVGAIRREEINALLKRDRVEEGRKVNGEMWPWKQANISGMS